MRGCSAMNHHYLTTGLLRSWGSALQGRSSIAGTCNPSAHKWEATKISHLSLIPTRDRPTRPSTGHQSRAAGWWVGRLPSPPWWRATTTSAWPPSPGQLGGVQQAPSLLPYSLTHLLGSLVNTATKNLVEKPPNI